MCLQLTPILRRAAEADPRVAAVVGVERAAVRAVGPEAGAVELEAAREVGQAVAPGVVVEREAARVAQAGVAEPAELVERAAGAAREERAAATAG